MRGGGRSEVFGQTMWGGGGGMETNEKRIAKRGVATKLYVCACV